MLDGVIFWLFDTGMGPPGPGGNWPLWLSLVFHGSNLVGGLGLTSLCYTIVTKWRGHREGVRFGQVFALFGFLPFLALARFARFGEAGGPPYHLTALIDFAAAVHLVYCGWRLPAIIDHILRLPSRKELHDARNDAQVKAAQLEIARLELVAWRKTMTGMVERVKDSAHYASRLEHLADIEAVADELRRGP